MVHRQSVNLATLPINGTIPRGQNFVWVSHNGTAAPRTAVVCGINDYAKRGGIGVNQITATQIQVAFPEGVTQDGDANFYGIAVV